MVTSIATLETTLRERLDESQTSQWTPTQLRRWLDEGLKDLGRRTFHWQDVITQAVTASVGEYVVSALIARINQVYFKPTGQTQMLPLQLRQWEGMDQIWYDQQNQVISYPTMVATRGYSPQLSVKLYPVPVVAGTLYLNVVRMPAAVDVAGGTGNIDCPDWWIPLVLDYAEYMALSKDRDQRWQDKYKLYEEKVADMINNGDYLNAPQEFVTDGPWTLDRWLTDPGYA